MKLPFTYKSKKRGCHWTILLVLGVAVIGWVITAFANLAETNNARVFWNHESPNCPGSEENHFDHSVSLNDSLGGGAAVAGGDRAVSIHVADFINSLDQPSNSVIEHQMGHGFGIHGYYHWAGSTPEGDSVMVVGSTSGESTITDGDTWLIRRIWKKRKSLGGW
jgi:hypothetical protein